MRDNTTLPCRYILAHKVPVCLQWQHDNFCVVVRTLVLVMTRFVAMCNTGVAAVGFLLRIKEGLKIYACGLVVSKGMRRMYGAHVVLVHV